LRGGVRCTYTRGQRKSHLAGWLSKARLTRALAGRVYHAHAPGINRADVVAAMMIVTPFVPLPRSIALDNRIPPGARSLFAVLQSHARQRASCHLGYARLCAILSRSEKTVRRWMRALIEAGYVEQERRGHMRSNLYTLTPFAHVSTAETGILEREKLPPIKTESLQDSSTKDIRETHTFCALLPSEPECSEVVQLPADVARLVADCGRELRDASPRSTATRVARLMAGSRADTDMYAAVQRARAITRRRLPRIRNRKGDRAAAFPYFLAVLARAVSGDATQTAPIASPPHEESERAVAVPVAVAVPQEDRSAWWASVNDACGVGDSRAFVALCQRPAPWPDVAWTLRLVREAQSGRIRGGA